MDRQVKGILGAKLGMTQVWDNNKVVPVTVVPFFRLYSRPPGRLIGRHPQVIHSLCVPTDCGRPPDAGRTCPLFPEALKRVHRAERFTTLSGLAGQRQTHPRR